jgi:hypothetical protein
MQDTAEHLAKPNRIVYDDRGNRIEFKPIYQHPYTGWEIVSVDPPCGCDKCKGIES